MTPELYTRECPLCKQQIIHKNKPCYYTMKKRNSPCRKCTNKLIGEKISKTTKGIPKEKFTEEHKKNLLIAHKNSKKWYDSMHTTEYKETHRINKIGEKNYMYGKKHTDSTKLKLSVKMKETLQKRPELIANLKNRKWTDEHRIKHKTAINNPQRLENLRIYRLNQIKESGKFTSFNKKACSFFNILNEKLNWNGKHALNGQEHDVDGYSVDYYNPDLNLIIEWDEERHFEPKKKEKDTIRQTNIINKINCYFYRIREKTKEIFKVDNLHENHIQLINRILNEPEQ